MDDAPAMVVSAKGFISLVKKEKPDLNTTHFLHHKALVAKTLGYALKSVLDNTKNGKLYQKQTGKITLVSLAHEEIEPPHVVLIFHTEGWWLSTGWVLSWVHEVKEEMLIFFTLEGEWVLWITIWWNLVCQFMLLSRYFLNTWTRIPRCKGDRKISYFQIIWRLWQNKCALEC